MMSWLILRRSILLGMVLGGVVGAVVGTIVLPVVGTCFGAWIGAQCGAVLGLVNAPFLIVTAKFIRRTWVASAAAGLVSGCLAAWAMAHGWSDVATAWAAVTCALLGALVGPIAAYGRRPHGVNSWLERTNRRSRAARGGFATGAVVGCLLGLAVGFAIGLRAYPPTSWAAAIEVAALATPVSAFIGAAISCAYRAHEPARHADPAAHLIGRRRD